MVLAFKFKIESCYKRQKTRHIKKVHRLEAMDITKLAYKWQHLFHQQSVQKHETRSLSASLVLLLAQMTHFPPKPGPIRRPDFSRQGKFKNASTLLKLLPHSLSPFLFFWHAHTSGKQEGRPKIFQPNRPKQILLSLPSILLPWVQYGFHLL